MDTTKPFSQAELDYLGSQRLGRLATVAPDGMPHNNPVGFRWNPTTATVDIYGYNLGATAKYRNARDYPPVSLVIDDVAGVDPWAVRGVEIRGEAETLDDVEPRQPDMSHEVLRIHPRRIIAWGIDDRPGMHGRDVEPAEVVA